MKDKEYIEWLEEKVVRLECELAEANERHKNTLANHLYFLDNLTKQIKNA